MFAKLTKSNITNLAETGYIARQYLAYFKNLIIIESMFDMSGKHVVFYGVVNDVENRCRSEIKRLGTDIEN